MSEAAILVDLDDIITEVSPAFQALSGWTEPELVGRALQQLFAVDGADMPGSGDDRSGSDTCSTVQSHHYRCRDGCSFQGEAVLLPLRDEEGSLQGSLHVLVDVPERPRHHPDLMPLIAFVARSNARDDIDVSKLLDLGCRCLGLEAGFLIRLDDENDRVEATGGDVAVFRGGQQLSGDRRLSSSLASDDQEFLFEHVAGATGSLSVFCTQNGFKTLLGRPILGFDRRHGLLCFASPHPRRRPFDDCEKQVLAFITEWLAVRRDAQLARLSRDETGRRLRTSQERHRALYEKTPAILHSIDDKGRLESVSDNWLSMMGYERDEVIGRPSTDFLTDESKRFARDVVLPAYRAQGRCDDVAYQFVTRGGDIRDVLLSAISEFKDDGSFHRSLAVLLDVTERKQVERTLTARTAALERSNADLRRFGQVASHDLQEPLRRIITYCDILKQDFEPELSEGAAEIAGVIRSGGRQLRLMINDLLAYVRVSEQVNIAFEPVDLSAVICQALGELDHEITSRDARVDIAHLPLVWGRAPLLKMVFLHLLGNAITHGGRPSPSIDISVDDAGDVWQFAVTDRGPGVEARFADRIFEIFQRLHPKDEREGSGTGLAICKLIVQRCGGEIWLDPSYEHGARFLFTLPKDKPDALLVSPRMLRP